ncbi:MAG: hypothetical protein HUU02_01365 [Bacteroidetes bacterium]|nr:hypothetical protein [Bacteroidota bacterium]
MLNGIVTDVFLARRSHSLLMAIGQQGDKLEGKPYTQFFSQIQGVLADHFIIHVTKLYEPPQRSHTNISIPTILKYIKSNQSNLPIIETGLTIQNLKGLGRDVNQEILKDLSLTDIILHHFNNSLPTIESSIELNALKVLRDKRISHREAIDISGYPTTTYKNVISLITFAEDFLCVVGPAFTSTIHGFAGEEYLRTNDAHVSTIAFERMIETLLLKDNP